MTAGTNVGANVRPELRQAIAQLQAIDGVVGALIATRDGVIVAATIADAESAQSLAATIAAIGGRLAEVAERLGVGGIGAVLADTSSHTLQFMPIGGVVLAVIAERHRNVRLIREGMRALALRLERHPAFVAHAH